MTKTHCDTCNKNFKNEEGLEMHNNAIHKAPGKTKKTVNTKKMKGWAIFVVILLVLFIGLYWMISSAAGGSSSCKNDPVTEINIGGHTNLAMHIHPNIQIIIDGVSQPIPANIGVSPGVMRPLHTHDSSGELHIEGPCRRDFTVGEFFQIWGRTFNSQCIFNSCTNAGTLEMTVNSFPNNDMENYEIKDKDRIVITYTSNLS